MSGERKATELLPEQKKGTVTLIPELLAPSYSTHCQEGFLKVNLHAADFIFALSSISAHFFLLSFSKSGVSPLAQGHVGGVGKEIRGQRVLVPGPSFHQTTMRNLYIDVLHLCITENQTMKTN